MNEPRSLEDIAREIVWPLDSELPTEIVDRALIEAGIEIGAEVERERFRDLVIANYHFQTSAQRENLASFELSAREQAGPDASESEVLAIAWNMRRNHITEREGS